MSLTIGTSPLNRPPGGNFNFDIAHLAPEHILYLEDVQKRVRGLLAGETIVDTRRCRMLYETGKFPQWYVPRDDVRAQALEPSELRRSDPFKGETTYYHVRVGDRLERDAAWSHEKPPGGFPLGGLVAFKFDRLDVWFEEDDPIRQHPRDPYHRFDCLHTSEHVLVRVGGEVVAETRRAIKLFETSIPPRYYIPVADVRPGCLVPSDSPRTYCPYKGEAAYFDVHAGATTVRDGAWTLPGPLGEALLTLGHVSFWGKDTEVIVDGRPTPT
ncbi:MAG: DUF427 domain-containing protein [Myxococcaceae bacterium]|nr:DUF427 domain-containing protein [Myxococcaceae bacterium]MCI0670127.1 DUF427 domain-containing protein [Myxococcaceae bacterium]